jgi:hypothetical protein
VLVVVVVVVGVVIVVVHGRSMGPNVYNHVLGMSALWFNIPSRVSVQLIIKMSASKFFE